MWVMKPAITTSWWPAASTCSPRPVPWNASGAPLTTTGSPSAGATRGWIRPISAPMSYGVPGPPSWTTWITRAPAARAVASSPAAASSAASQPVSSSTPRV